MKTRLTSQKDSGKKRHDGRKENSYSCFRAKSAILATGCCNMKMKEKG